MQGENQRFGPGQGRQLQQTQEGRGVDHLQMHHVGFAEEAVASQAQGLGAEHGSQPESFLQRRAEAVGKSQDLAAQALDVRVLEPSHGHEHAGCVAAGL